MSLVDKLNLALRASLGLTFADALWYASLAGAAWLLFYILFPRIFRRRRVADVDPTRQQVMRELLHSLRSLAIFGLVAAAMVLAAIEGWTRVYVDDPRYGGGWFVASIVLMVLIHDAYFYWTHRLMHHPYLYHRMHHTHHLSTSPTPWAAYAFSPAEAFVQAGIAPVIMFTIPTHPGAFALFMIWQISFNVLGHCGHELFPRAFVASWTGRVLNTTTHHALHHEKFRANFGLYFNWWDRLMGTNHADYQARFDSVVSGANVGGASDADFTRPHNAS
jgi:sterol desaturase/sphingolipid hydroxylase (fatty acid hydroxylase superfamily)